MNLVDFFTGQITDTGKVSTSKSVGIGAGVAGLAANGAANSLGAIVRALTLVLKWKSRVQSMGASFLEIDFKKKEGGSGDGYAKVMSEEFNQVLSMELVVVRTTLKSRRYYYYYGSHSR